MLVNHPFSSCYQRTPDRRFNLSILFDLTLCPWTPRMNKKPSKQGRAHLLLPVSDLFKLKKNFDTSMQVITSDRSSMLTCGLTYVRQDTKRRFISLSSATCHKHWKKDKNIQFIRVKKIKIQYHLDKEWVGIIQIDNPQNTINTLTQNNRI